MHLPPGIRHIALSLPRLLTPPALVYTLRFLSWSYLGYEVPNWAFVVASLLSLPVALAGTIYYNEYAIRRDAAANGAILVPKVEDWTPGGLRSMAAAVSNLKVGYPGDVFDQWTQKYGPTVHIRILFESRIFTTEPEYIKAILATQFDNHEKGAIQREQLASVLGTGVFNSDGEMWKFHRAMTRPFFSKDRVSHFDNFGRHADDAIAQIKARFKEGYAVDFQDAVARFTLDSATEFLFGCDVRSLSAALPYPQNSPNGNTLNAKMANHPANEFAEAFRRAQEVLALRTRYGFNWPLKEFWRDESTVHVDFINKFIDPILSEALNKKKESGDTRQVWKGTSKGDREVEDGETLLDHLVNYTDDRTILMDEILNMMVAGRDTTAATLTFVIYMLAEHPNVMKRLREEILSKVGSERHPSYDDLRDMKYLRAVINETLRLYPAVAFNTRATNKATLWPPKEPGGKPYYIPPNTKTPYSVFLMHRREDLWGPDAQVFDPDRFLDHRLHKYLTPNPFIFLPFNAGPRICLGQQFAYNEVSFFLVRLLQNFSSVTLAPDAQPPESKPPALWKSFGGRQGKEKITPKSHVTIYAYGGIWVRMEEAETIETV